MILDSTKSMVIHLQKEYKILGLIKITDINKIEIILMLKNLMIMDLIKIIIIKNNYYQFKVLHILKSIQNNKRIIEL
jgi:hypothetical protein